MKSITRTDIWIFLSFATIYIIWVSTYLFLAFAVEEITPFLMAGMRCIASCLILFGLLNFFRSRERPTRKQIRNALFVGVLFLTFGMGSVSWALQYVDTGFTALLIATQPLIIVLMNWALYKQKPSSQAYLGIALGMIGSYLLVSQNEIIVDLNQWQGVGLIFFSLLSWGYGALFVSRADLPKFKMTSNAIQMLSGGIGLFILSLFLEDPIHFEFEEVSQKAWLSLAYLITFGMVLGFSAFNYLLTKVSPEKVSTSTYVNPIIALLLGWWFRDELITNQSIIAAVIMFTGVFFINTNRKYF